MAKILESDFRKELYKNLVEAGYEKMEAQKIIGNKYHVALKESLADKFKELVKAVDEENYDAIVIDNEQINGTIEELKKVKELLK